MQSTESLLSTCAIVKKKKKKREDLARGLDFTMALTVSKNDG